MLGGILGTGGRGLSPYISIMASIVVDFGSRVLVLVGSMSSGVEEDSPLSIGEGQTAVLFGCVGTLSVRQELSCGSDGQAYLDLRAMLALQGVLC